MLRVLHIEDDPSIVQLLQIAMAEKGYEVVEAEGGTAGLKMAYEVLPHAVLLDINMPVTDGFDVLQSMTSHSGLREMPVICVTAVNKRGHVERAYRLGASGYVFKPVDLKILTALLEFHTSRSDLESRVTRLMREPAFHEASNAARGKIRSLLELDIVRYLGRAGGTVATTRELAGTLNAEESETERSLDQLEARGLLEPRGREGGVRARGDENSRQLISRVQKMANDERLRTAFINLVFLGVLDE